MSDDPFVEAQFGAQADFNGDGRSDLMVAHLLGNEVLLRAADGSYAAGVTIPGPHAPTWLAADIDNDGDPDLLAMSENMLHVLINAGVSEEKWRGFEEMPGEPLELPGAGNILQLTAADWSGDGRTDLALGTTEGVFVRLADENGTLGPITAYPLDHGDQRRLVSGDFDRDGDLDLASASSSYTGASLHLLVNDGEGIFEARAMGARLGNYVRDLVAGDLDRDGDTDLVVGYQYAYGGNLDVLTNDGQGGFTGAPLTDAAGMPTHLALGDVDDDGSLDLAVSHAGGWHGGGVSGVSVYMGQANGTLGPREFVHFSNARAVTIETLRGGAERTMTVFNWNGGIQVLRHVTPDLFPAEVETNSDDWSSAPFRYIVATGDWNGDGRDDVIEVEAQGGQTLRISLGLVQPDATYVWNPLPLFEDGHFWIIAELTGDDRPDIGLMRYNSQSWVVLPQTETRAPGNPVSTQLPGNFWHDSVVYDFNQDQMPDLLLRRDTGAVRALFGSGAGQFTLGPVITTVRDDMRVADLNSDTRPDLAVISGNSLRTLLGQSDGTFQEALRIRIDVNSYIQVWQDFTSDGRTDLVLSSPTMTRIFTGSADGTFREAVGSPLAGYLEPRFPDVDLDGRSDLLIVAGEAGRLIVWKTNADGSLADPIETAIPREAYPYLQQDLNGDEFLDFVLASQTRVVVLLGRGDGSFGSAFEPLRVSNGLAHLSAATDFSGDARPDLLMLSSAGLQIWVWDVEGSLVEFFELPLPSRQFWVARTEDFNGDEIDDYVFVEANTNRSHVIISGAETPFINVYSFPTDTHVVLFEDLTGDQVSDVLTRTSNGDLTIWRNEGDWTFTPLDLVLPRFGDVQATDFNGDGLPDLLVQSDDSLAAWLNVDGTSFREYFNVHRNGWFGWFAWFLQGDLNHDGHRDIVVGWGQGPGQRLTLLLSDEDGSFARPLTYVFPRTFNLGNVVLGDIDGDGDLDITLEAGYYSTVGRGVMINQADQFWPAGDANRDGRFDSADLVAVFGAGQYEDGLPRNSTWLEGDWNGDGDFTSQDLVLAFQLGTYEAPAELLDRDELADIVLAQAVTRQVN